MLSDSNERGSASEGEEATTDLQVQALPSLSDLEDSLPSVVISVLSSMDPQLRQRFLLYLHSSRRLTTPPQGPLVAPLTMALPPPGLPRVPCSRHTASADSFVIFVSNIPTQDTSRLLTDTRSRRRPARPQSLYENVRQRVREDFEEYFARRAVLITQFEMFCDRKGNLTGSARMAVLTADMMRAVLARRSYRVRGRSIRVAPFLAAPALPPPSDLLAAAPACPGPARCAFSRLPADRAFELLAKGALDASGLCQCVEGHARNCRAARVELRITREPAAALSDSVLELRPRDRLIRSALLLSPSLRRLHVASRALEADFPAFLSRACPRLELLELTNVQLSGGALWKRTRRDPAPLPALRRLKVANVQMLGERGLRSLLRCYGDGLRELHVGQLDLQRPLKLQLASLCDLTLSQLILREECFRALFSAFPNLRALCLDQVNLVPAPHLLQGCPEGLGLTQLTVSGGLIAADCLQDLLAASPQLRKLSLVEVNLRGGPVWSLHLPGLACAASLCELDLRGGLPVTGDLANFARLQRLTLSATQRRQQALQLAFSFARCCRFGNAVTLHESIPLALLQKTRASYEALAGDFAIVITRRPYGWAPLIVSIQLNDAAPRSEPRVGASFELIRGF